MLRTRRNTTRMFAVVHDYLTYLHRLVSFNRSSTGVWWPTRGSCTSVLGVSCTRERRGSRGKSRYPATPGAKDPTLCYNGHTSTHSPVDALWGKARRAHREHITNTQSPCFVLARVTRGSAARVVKRFENSGQPNDRGAWLELVRIYGRSEMDKRTAQLLALKGKSRDVLCLNLSYIPDSLVG